MAININRLFTELFENFFKHNEEVNAIIISDDHGLIISGDKREEIDMEIISVLTAVVNPILERIRNEFAFKKFGTASFDTDEHRLLFVSVDENTTLSLVIDTMASIDKLYPYAYFLAEKSAQIINYEEDNAIQLQIPTFEYEAEQSERLKNQIYQMRLDKGGLYRFKFIIIGNHEVGKTSIVRRYVDNRFSKDYRATIGLNVMSHTFEFLGNEVSIALWDIGAQSYFKRFRKTYYTGAQASFIVFDLTNRQSYEDVQVWYNELVEFLGIKDIPIVIVGNKMDLVDQRAITYQEGVTLATNLSQKGISKISYIETSALTGEHVDDAFSLISYFYIQKSQELEEKILKEDLIELIDSILQNRESLTLSSITKTPFWNPALQILTDLKEYGEFSRVIEEESEKTYQFKNGLTIKSFTYDSFNMKDSDGVLCIFDARKTDTIDPKWKEITIKIIEQVQEGKVILVGVRVSDETDWSKILEEFDVNEYLEQKMVSLMFFKIGVEYRLEIYDQLEVMLNSIKEFQS
ncbi:MAG: Rab family GTPase [Candidatus Hermodarchaeota archaeon]